jgi:hypothetical protein
MTIAGMPVTSPQQVSEVIPVTSDAVASPSRLLTG